MKLPNPRHYQKRALDLTKKAYIDGFRKILIYLATGGGKSVIFLHLVYNSLCKGQKVILVMRRKQLVHQAYKHFAKHGIKASVIMASDKRFNPELGLQICSIDTIGRTSKTRDTSFLENFDAVVVDEAHDTTSPKYREFFSKLKAELFLGLTATPFNVGRKVQDFWECCVKPIEIQQLVDEGFLTKAVIKLPDGIDLTGVKKTGGDYNNKQLGEVMSDLEIIGNVVDDYKKFGNNKSAICFAVNKEHSIKLCDEFNQQGIPAIHCDESTKQKDRDKALEMLANGKIKILNNVNIFSTGVDCPEAEVLILARPTMSEILYIQQVGRGLRPHRICGKCNQHYDNSPVCYHCGYDKPKYIKKFCTIIDNANNIYRHGHPFKIRYAALKQEDIKKKKEADEREFRIKNCKVCFTAYPANLKKCPECGGQNEKVQREIKRVDGQLVPYDEFSRIMGKFLEYERVKLERGLKPNFPFFKLYEEFGDVVYQYAELNVPKWVKKIVDQNKEQGKVYK